jgi:hypothetical protein
MSTLRRIILIFVAALAVVGGTIGLAQSGALASLTFGQGGEGRPEASEFQLAEGSGLQEFQRPRELRSSPPDGQFEQLRGDFGDGPRGERLRGGAFGLGTVAKNLVIIGGIVAAVVVGSLVVDWIRRGRRAAA